MKKVYYVYMHNTTDRRDDEVFKVKASSEPEAKSEAESHSQGRFSVGWAKPATPKSKRDKAFLRDYKWWSTDYT